MFSNIHLLNIFLTNKNKKLSVIIKISDMKAKLIATIFVLFIVQVSFSQVRDTHKTPQKEGTTSTVINTQKPQINSNRRINTQELINVSKPVIENKENGKINWTEQYVEATGTSYMDFEKFKIEGQAADMAKRGAIVIAQRNLLEIINGVRVTSQTVVKDLVTESDLIMTRIDGVIKGAQTVGEPVVTKTSVQVTMRIPIYDQQKGLAPIVQKAMADKDPELGKRISQNNQAASKSETAEELPAVAFDFKGNTYNPSIFPKFVDKDGKVLLDLSEYYNPQTGEFPKYLQLTKDIFKDTKFKEGISVVDALIDKNGNIKVDITKNAQVKKWFNTITNVVSKVAPLLISLI